MLLLLSIFLRYNYIRKFDLIELSFAFTCPGLSVAHKKNLKKILDEAQNTNVFRIFLERKKENSKHRRMRIRRNSIIFGDAH